MKQFLITIIVVFAATFVHAQDKIFRKNGQVIKAKILEISSADIKYKEEGKADGPVYVLEKERILKVEYADGKVEKFVSDYKDPELYKGQLTKAIKINFISPLIGYTEVGFEKSIGVGKSYELLFGIIGAGKNQWTENWSFFGSSERVRKSPFGLYASAGYKFSKLPDFLFFKPRLSHIMQGSYVKPQIYLGNYSENIVVYKGSGSYVPERKNISFGALQIEFGKQWVFGEKFLVDVCWGLV